MKPVFYSLEDMKIENILNFKNFFDVKYKSMKLLFIWKFKDKFFQNVSRFLW